MGTQFKAEKLKKYGTYTIKVQYGEPNQTAETTFDYVKLKSIMKIKSELGITQDIPRWINVTFNFYLEQKISEKELIAELEYLIKQEIIHVE